MSEKNEKKTRKTVELQVSQLEWKPTSGSEFYTSSMLEALINDIFFPVFKDYCGCVVQPSMNPNSSPVEVSLYFKLGFVNGDCADGTGVQAFTTSLEANTNSGVHNTIAAAIDRHNKVVRTTTAAVITEEAMGVMYDLLCPQFKWVDKAKNPDAVYNVNNYKRVVQETTSVEQVNVYQPAKQVITECISGIDINAILKMIYRGKKDRNHYFWTSPLQAIPMNSKEAVGTTQRIPWLFNVVDIDGKKLNEISSRVAPVNSCVGTEGVPFYNSVSRASNVM